MSLLSTHRLFTYITNKYKEQVFGNSISNVLELQQHRTNELDKGLTKGLDIVDKAGVGGKKWISQKWLSNETNKQTKPLPPCT